MSYHNWSGWPGAYCLKCGAESNRERCVAEHEWPPCPDCHGSGDVDMRMGFERCDTCSGTGCIPCNRPECHETPCFAELTDRPSCSMFPAYHEDPYVD